MPTDNELPTDKVIVTRLRELAKAVTLGKDGLSEFYMHIPARPNKDADLVLGRAAKRIESLIDENSQLKLTIALCQPTEDTINHYRESNTKMLMAVEIVNSENDKMKQFLKMLCIQKTADEIEEEDVGEYHCTDFEDIYDSIINESRELMEKINCE